MIANYFNTWEMYYCFIFSNVYQNNTQIRSGFPLISGQIPPTSECSDWLDWEGYTKCYTSIQSVCVGGGGDGFVKLTVLFYFT